jgi:hypothetical protein
VSKGSRSKRGSFTCIFQVSSILLKPELSGVKILKVPKGKLRLNLNYLNTQVLFFNNPMIEALITA